MSLRKYKSTRETTNLARVARMILGPCTDVLCDLLRKDIPLPALMHKVNTFIANFPKHKPCPINKDQQKLVWGGNYSEFDITLLYTLLRNLSTFPPPSNGWGNDPDKNDRSVSANIERIRLERNKYGHKSDIYLTDTAFNEKHQNILSIVQDLGGYLGADTSFQDGVADIKTCSMDPEQEAKYISELLDLNSKLDYVLEEVQNARTTSVPHSVKALYERDISEWKDEDSVFLETHNFPVMLNQVRQQPFVTFVGVPGSGKTTIVRHIALILQKEGYEILPIKEINKIEDYCSKNIPQVFVIDDMLGVFRLNEHELHMIEKYKERLLNPMNPETRTLMTCREAVFKNEMLSDCILVENENVVNLQSPEYALNEVDKQNLLQKYKLDGDLLYSKHLTSSSKMFPLLCKLYSSKPDFKCYGPTFFTTPIRCIIDELNLLKTKNKLQYASLVLLMANKNKLSEKIFNDEKNRKIPKKNKETSFDEIKCRILDKTKVSSATDNFQFINALSEMEGTYTKKSGDKFAFIHISIFEIIAFHFGQLHPDLILQCTSSSYIANRIKVEKDTNTSEHEKDQVCGDNQFVDKPKSDTVMDLRIFLKESEYPLLAQRLFRDVQNGKFYNVFENAALKHPSFVQCFIAVLEKEPYVSLYNSLMSEYKNSSKILNTTYKSAKCGVDEMKYMGLKKEADQLLIDERLCRFGKETSYPNRSSVRGIKWVIRFGHYQILQSILNIIKQKKKGMFDDLFLNCYNKRHQTSSNLNQDNTGTKLKISLNLGKTGKLYEETGNVGEDHRAEIDTDSDTHNCLKSCRSIEEDSSKGTDMDDDTNVETYNEPKIIEQCCLLCLACFSGDLNTVKTLLKHVNKDALNNTSCPSTVLYYLKKNPLTIACKYGFLDIVVELLKFGADVNQNFPIFNACIKGHCCIVKKLIAAEACVNLPDHGDLPLLAACKRGYVNVVQELITAGADINAKIKCLSRLVNKVEDFHEYDILMTAKKGLTETIEEKTPLIAACDGGHFNVMKLLIKSGAKVDPKYNDYTTINFPCYWDHLNKVRKLTELDSSFDLNDTKDSSLITACYHGRLGLVKNKIIGGTDVNIKDGDRTPLIVACYKENLPVVKELLDAGADVNLKNEFVSPLQVACYEGHLNVVKELHNAEFNGQKMYSFETALLVACYCGHLSVVKELIACNVEVNMKHGEETPLTNACYMGHTNIFEELIKAGADVNLHNESRTPLTVACFRGHINIVRELIKWGANVNQSVGKETPLTAACEGRHVDVVIKLIEAGAGVNQSDGNKTPLIAVCGKGTLNLVIELIAANANVNQSDGNKTPLTTACELGHWTVAEELIKAGADVNQSDGYNTPLTAVFVRRPRIVINKLIDTGADVNQSDENEIAEYNTRLWIVVKMLIDAGADVNQSDGNKTPLTTCKEEHWFVVPELIKAGADVNQSDGKKTPLTTACENGHVVVINALIEAEADVNKTDGKKIPLTAACGSGHLNVVNALIKAGAKINESDGNTTPLTAACESGCLDVVQVLIKDGANVNQSDGNKTPLSAAYEQRHWTVVRELIKAGANVNINDGNKIPLTDTCERGHWDVVKALIRAEVDVNQNNGNKTPLTFVCESGQLNVVKAFIKAGADVNQSDGNKTPLTAACKNGHLNVVKTLIKAGAEVNKSDGNNTPLTAACKSECLNIVEKLIKAGADVNQSDGSKIPLMVACEKGHLKVVQELIKAGANVNQSDTYNTVMTAAFERKHLEVVNELIRANVDVD